MPKKGEPLTLHELISKIKQAPARTEEIIPGVFSGSNVESIHNIDIQQTPFFYPKENGINDTSYFYAPMGHSPQQAANRALAYGMGYAGRHYIPYSLNKKEDMDGGWLDTLRRATGASLLSDAGVSEIDERNFRPIYQEDTVYHIAQNAMHALGTPQEKEALKEAKGMLRGLGYKKQAGLLKSALYGAIEAAKTRTDLVPHILALQELFGTQENPNPDAGDQPGEGEDEIEKMLAELEARQKQTNYDPYQMTGKPPEIQNITREPQWGEMEHLELPRKTRMVQSGKKSKVWKRAGVGAFRFPWRALKTSDLQCFAVKRKVYGGTLLFDISGSMGVTPDHIKAILTHSPEATMACYGGHTSTEGRLVIMAKDGMAADPAEVRAHVGGGNVVDGPALQWLASMPEPRIWVSDGHAIGIAGECDISHVEYCQKFAKMHRITQIASAQKLVDLLKAKSS